MPEVKRALPFPRGETYNADSLLTMSTTLHDHLEGKFYTVPDTVHNTGKMVTLMVCKNRTGSAITIARKFCELTAEAALGWGCKVTTFPCNTAGAVAVPLDDAMTNGGSIAANDLFYVVVEGPCYVLTGAAVTNLAAGAAVTTDNAGLIANKANAAAGEFCVGTLDYLASYSAATNTIVNVSALPLVMPPAAG